MLPTIMEPTIRQTIEAIHQAPIHVVLAVTGGGTGAGSWLLAVPGASRTVLELIVPYHEQALGEYLGRRPEQFCSPETSQAMARRAFERAAWLLPRQAVLGVGCTASLATDRPKRGDHRFHLTIHTPAYATTWSLVLAKGARGREAEEYLLDCIILNALAEAAGIPDRLPVELLAGEKLERDTQPASRLTSFLEGKEPTLCVTGHGKLSADAPRPAALLAGSFNPLHEAHLSLAALAARKLAGPVAFELSVANVDKPALPAWEVLHRIQQFAWRSDVWLTHAPTFVEKAELFPGVVFIVGADTAERIVESRYYGSEGSMIAALVRVRERGCRFLVAGRTDEGRFQGLDELAIPPAISDLFSAIPEHEFRLDISSTQLRQAGGGRVQSLET